MSKKSFNPDECISALNSAKQALQMTERPFTKETVLKSLAGCGLPTNNTFWTAFRNSGILQEVSKGKFMFVSKEPIYVGALRGVKTRYHELQRRYNRRKEEPKVEAPKQDEPVVEEVAKHDPQAMTQFAIDLLKEQGYQIFAPVGIIYRQC